MKKTITIMLFIIMCFTLISCNNTKNDENNLKEDNTSITNEMNSNVSSDNNENQSSSETDKDISYNGKNVKEINIFAMGNKVNMEFSELTPLLTIEDEGEAVDNVSEKSVFGNIKLVYEDDSEFEFGEIIISDDNAFYLKLHNGKFYKMADGFLNN